jgi:hypothetical protein
MIYDPSGNKVIFYTKDAKKLAQAVADELAH